MYKPLKLLIRTLSILLALPLQIFAQDLTGVWTGFLEMGDSKLPYELVISGDKKNLSGYSLMTFTFNGVENVGLKTMEIKIKRGSIAIEDGELIYDNYNTPPRKVKLYGSLAWVGRDSNMTLAGEFVTRSLDMRALNENSFKGLVRLHKKRSFGQTKLVSKLDEMNLLNELSFMQPAPKNTGDKTKNTGDKATSTKSTKEPPKDSKTKSTEVVAPTTKTKTNPQPKETEKQPEKTTMPVVSAAEVAKRETEIIQTVVFKSDSLVLSLYDNGEIDGDTVSVVLNGQVIIAKQGLTAKPITTTIQTSSLSDSLQLVMYAENLGRIPPNSGLLILQDGVDRYRIRFSGDLQTNSAIILKRKR